MSMSNKIFALLACGLVLGGCLGEETGISQRHIQGIVTMPPVPLWETEPTPRAAEDALNNDTDSTSDGPFSIAYGYHIIRGTSDKLCDPMDIEAGAVPDCDIPLGQDPDVDVYRIRAAYQGPIAFKARLDGEIEDGDVDIKIYQGGIIEPDDANLLWGDGNATTPVLDDNGDEVVDEDGDTVQRFVLPRFGFQVEDGDEFLVAVTVSGSADVGAYELVIVGNDPRKHNIELGIEGDTASFSVGESEDEILEQALPLLVGAFLSNDIENLGDPVAGTSCETWIFDAEGENAETFWCAYDMVFAHQVTVESGVLIDGMGDGKDNDCDGIADDGTGTADADGDGFTIEDGDCNDTDPDVGPFRGDVAGDRKDNDCDGWADNGPDDKDDDGDGYCESPGFDLNGDGFCRGPQEIGGLSQGDCNDANADIHPGFDQEYPSNGLDDDCTGGDGGLDFATNSDDDETVYDANDVHEWSDIEEIACGTDEEDPTDFPVDADQDGICDSECLGEAGCPQDNDADGAHNWTELLCGSDGEDASSLPQDIDGDGTCNGQDVDADDDGFIGMDENGGDDCNDLDATIHPHLTDEVGTVLQFNYDVPNGINDDCDDFVDENADWSRAEDGTFSQNDDFLTTDQDGDGYSLGLRDCDDTDPEMRLGNYETRTTNVVSSDFTIVNIFAGDVGSLNNTAATANARRVTELVPFDLSKDRVVWELTDQWEELDNPPLLTAGSLPISEAYFAKQPELGNIWFELEPNDAIIAGFGSGETLPWSEGNYQELGESAGAGKTNELYGEIGSIVADSWAGDNDAFHLTFPEAGVLNVSVDWDASADYDAVFYCWYFDAINPPSYYSIPFSPGLTDLSKPEEGLLVVPLPDGADCYFWVVGYAGGLGAWKMEITPQGN